ncbi:MAG: DNA polymerase I [Armatimonadetes bacterium]|nr:DNA polymerase I [Armatimonadota bacterium]
MSSRQCPSDAAVMTMARKFLAVDGNSLLFRAFHALPSLTTTTGQPTGALLGFAEMLLNLLEQEKPDAAVVVFDARGPTFRHEQYPQYKANRPPTPPELAQQVELAHQLVGAFGMKTLEVPGVEADDVIATLARRAAAEGWQVLAVSGDRDLVQIVGPQVRLLATVRGFTDTRLYDEDRVREEFSVEPRRVAELKGLGGDSSDNIPGVPGIGPKTARKLLQQYGSLDELYKHLDEIQPPRIANLLREHRQSAELGARLATVADDVPLDAQPDDFAWPGPDWAHLRRLFAELEFSKLLPRLPEAEAVEALISVACTPEEVEELVRQAGPQLGLAVAVLNERAVGVAFAGRDRAVYVPLGTTELEGLFADTGATEAADAARRILADPAVLKTCADAKRDMTALEAAGLALDGVDFDVSLAAYMVSPHRGVRALETLAMRHLGYQLPAAEVADAESAAQGIGRLALAAIELRPVLERELDQIGAGRLFREVEMPLIPILRAMERAGIAVDREALQRLGAELDQLTADLAHRIYELAGREFNLDSPRQLEKVLFEDLGLPRAGRTKTGYSTSAAVLEKLAQEHEIARLILEYREYAKLRSTYVEGLLRLADDQGRVHTTFEQQVVATGRLSSRNPNLQNIPIRTEWGRKIRACFVAPGPDWLLVSADYSQIELRILAHLSGEPRLISAFERDEDIHQRTAALIFDVPPEAVNSDMRRVAKTVNYAVLYGMGPVSLAEQIGVSRQQAEEFIAHYFRELPQVKNYLDRTIAEARERLWVETVFGRRRPLPDLASEDARQRAYAERAAANTPIQGTAADIMKIAMVRLADRLPQSSHYSRLLLQVHDELVLETPRDEVDTVAAIVKEVMQNAAELKVPLKADVKAGPNWRDMQELT